MVCDECVREDVGVYGDWRGFSGDVVVDLVVRGCGIGRALVTFATGRHGVVCVDVNEQNPQATGFYGRMGFVVAGCSETDDEGRPFSMLHMVLERTGVARISGVV